MQPVVHVVGARPNFMKAAPVVDAAISLGERPLLIHTGQHYDAAMSDVFFNQLGMPEPDLNLGVGSGSHARQTAALMESLESSFLDITPRGVVVYGDINSTLAATLVAAKLHIPVAHVEAGLRSFDRTMPEEINRVVTDALANLHFTTSPEAMAHLAAEGIRADSMHFVGNPMIDTLLRFRDVLDTAGAKRAHHLPDAYGVVTLHRPANVDDPERARNIVEGLSAIATRLPLLVPLHPRGAAVLESVGLHSQPSIHVVEPLGYLEFMAAVAGASLVITDSGGIQEETTVLGIPCLTVRDNTERPITVTMGTNRLVAATRQAIEQAAEDALGRTGPSEVPPLWDGRAGERIARILAATF